MYQVSRAKRSNVGTTLGCKPENCSPECPTILVLGHSPQFTGNAGSSIQGLHLGSCAAYGIMHESRNVKA